MSAVPQLVERAEAYCRRTGLIIGKRLGFGVHGNVFAAYNQINGKTTAIKVFENERFYQKEWKVYRRLQEFEVTHINAAAVPEFIDRDDELWVIEMTIVSRPFLCSTLLAPISIFHPITRKK